MRTYDLIALGLIQTCIACAPPLEPGDVDGTWVAVLYLGQPLPLEDSSSLRIVVLADTLRLMQGAWRRITARTIGTGLRLRYEPIETHGWCVLGPSEVRLQVSFCENRCDRFWVGKLQDDGRLVFGHGLEYVRH